ncbi:MAG: hypothetical protein LBM26_01845 [Methanobrevibacter sp.]|nr:hypothetical protein [Methanobrevibacter sp.]
MNNSDSNSNSNNNCNNKINNNDNNKDNKPNESTNNKYNNEFSLDDNLKLKDELFSSEEMELNEDILKDIGFDKGFELEKIDFPEIAIETEDLSIILGLKKDYSTIKDIEKRKKVFKKDIFGFFEEFMDTNEFLELMEYYK